MGKMLDERVKIEPLHPDLCEWAGCDHPARYEARVPEGRLSSYAVCGYHVRPVGRWLLADVLEREREAAIRAAEAKRRSESQRLADELERVALIERIKTADDAGWPYPLVFGPRVPESQREAILAQLVERE